MTATVVLPLVTLVLGYFGSLYTERWRERATRERELAERVEARRQALQDRRDAFELKHMQEMMPALGALARASVEVYLADLHALRAGVAYGQQRLDPAVDERARQVRVQVHELRELLLDDDARDAVRSVQDAWMQVVNLREVAEQEAHAATAGATDATMRASEVLGRRIRELHALPHSLEPAEQPRRR